MSRAIRKTVADPVMAAKRPASAIALLALTAFMAGCGFGGAASEERNARIDSLSFQAFSDHAVISWETDIAGGCRVEYGATAAYGLVATIGGGGTSMNATLPSLEPDTEYRFRVTTLDPSGGAADSWSDVLRTAASAPGSHAASAEDLGGGVVRYTYDWSTQDQLLDWLPTSGATISRSSGTPPLAVISGGTTDVRGMRWNRPIAVSRITASASTSNAAQRHVNIYANLDDEWNGSPWNANPSIGTISAGSSTFWMLDGIGETFACPTLAADVFYDFEFTVSSTEISRTCSVNGTRYARTGTYAQAADGRIALGAYAGTTSWGTVVIEGAPSPDSPVAAPTITGISAVTDDETAISWSTDIPADSLVEYGTDGRTFGSRVSSSDLTLGHSILLDDLQPGTEYWYRISSRAASGATTTRAYRLVPGGDLRADEIVFKTTGSAFEAIIEVDAGAAVEWIFADGTSSSLHPVMDYGTSATRFNRLKVTPWSAIRTIDIGYDGGDGGQLDLGTYEIDRETVEAMDVTAVYGLANAAPSLRIWTSSWQPLLSLDFSGFAQLHTMEAFLCQSMRSIGLSNTPSLRRLCLEDNAIEALDLSGCPNLEDLRGAQNNYASITWGATGAQVWHICIRDNPQITVPHPDYSRFPLLVDLFIWNTGQSGTLALSPAANPRIRYVIASGNRYSSANLSGIFPAGRNGVIEVYNNDLTSLDVSGNYGLSELRAQNNDLDEAAVDAVLAAVDAVGTNGGTVDLAGNAVPSATGAAHVANLQGRGWTVTVEE